MNARVILILSICLNALAGVYFVTTRPASQATVEATTGTPSNSPASSDAGARMRRIQNVTLVQTNIDGSLNWASLESEDYRQYIENLRRVGCPEETIRDIIIADVEKLYARRIAALYPTPADFKFWKVEDRSARTEDRQREEKRRELEREKRNLIQELLGFDPDTDLARRDGRPDEDAYRLGFLTPEKQAQLQALSSKYRDLQRALMGEGGGRGGFTPENRARFAELRTKQEAEMAALLGPKDYEEYQLRNSFTARNMRENLTAFQPSEEEFRQIFELRKSYDTQFAFARDGGDEAQREQRKAAQLQLETQLKATLGEERFREYQMSQDERYRDIYEFTQAQKLPPQTAQGVYDIRQVAETQRQKILADTTLTPEKKTAALAGIADETKASLAETLGPEAYKNYTQGDGRWVTRLDRTETREGAGEEGTGFQRGGAGGRFGGGAPGTGGQRGGDRGGGGRRGN